MHGSRSTVMAVFALTLFAAVAHGVATNRWNGGDAAPTMPPVPKQFGGWVGRRSWRGLRKRRWYERRRGILRSKDRGGT